MTPDKRTALIEKASEWGRLYGAQATEMIGPIESLDDVQLNARMEAIEASSAMAGWKREKLVADLTAAGDREMRADRYNRTGRADAPASTYASPPRINWPDGFDRKSAIEALREAGVYPREVKPSDLWIFGALMRLFDIGWSKSLTREQALAELVAAEILATDFGQPIAEAPIEHVMAAYKSLRMRRLVQASARTDAATPTDADRRMAEVRMQAHRADAEPAAYGRMVEREAQRLANQRSARGRR